VPPPLASATAPTCWTGTPGPITNRGRRPPGTRSAPTTLRSSGRSGRRARAAGDKTTAARGVPGTSDRARLLCHPVLCLPSRVGRPRGHGNQSQYMLIFRCWDMLVDDDCCLHDDTLVGPSTTQSGHRRPRHHDRTMTEQGADQWTRTRARPFSRWGA
jgi:hypothetical protein